MQIRNRLVIAALVAGAALAAIPDTASAQPHRAVRVARPRTTVFIGAYYDPFIYRPFYPAWYRAWYSPWYYGAYAQFPPYYGRGYYSSSAALRLQVSPRETEVFIDGYYAGTVDDFDGVFQRLHLEPGEHDLELYLAGYRNNQQKVYLQPGKTFSVRYSMEPLAPGDPPAVRPAGGTIAPSGPGTGPDPRQRRERREPPSARRPDPGVTPESGFGSLALRVQPSDAQVFIDAEPWTGAADGERLVVELAPGAHRLEIRKDGYRTYITEITVRARETTTLNVAMNRQ